MEKLKHPQCNRKEIMQCPNREKQDGTCLLRNIFNCPYGDNIRQHEPPKIKPRLCCPMNPEYEVSACDYDTATRSCSDVCRPPEDEPDIEAVRRIAEIVLEIRQYLCNTEFAPEPEPVDMNVLKVEFPTKILEICQLFLYKPSLDIEAVADLIAAHDGKMAAIIGFQPCQLQTITPERQARMREEQLNFALKIRQLFSKKKVKLPELEDENYPDCTVNKYAVGFNRCLQQVKESLLKQGLVVQE